MTKSEVIGTLTGFVAYPSSTEEVYQSIRAACEEFRRRHPSSDLDPWENNDIAGYCLTDPILEKIRQRQLLVADVTRLNFNVIYEIGFAIGLQKRVILIRNKSIITDDALAREVGLFDTLGQLDYANSMELIQQIELIKSYSGIPLPSGPLNKQVPVYIVFPRERTEAEIRVHSRITTGGIYFRSFDPVENVRLSVRSAMENVYQSIGVVLLLLSGNRADAVPHNLRSAFVAGLAHALEKETLLLQAGSKDPVPLDLRDHVSVYHNLDSINRIIAEFAPRITKRLQEQDEFVLPGSSNRLADLFLGESAAENEIAQLGNYYLQTEEFNRLLNQNTSVVAGRKGSGKSALFFRVRNQLRKNKQNIVVDLNPEAYQLQKFTESVLRHLEKGTKDHTVTAFWEYLLLLEICVKLLDNDRKRHTNDHLIRDHYQRVLTIITKGPSYAEGDLAERMLKLTEGIEEAFTAVAGPEAGQKFLSNAQITEILYRHDIKDLRETVVAYLALKEEVWILFDNFDKGWHAHGIRDEDLLILRCLIDALSKLKRELQRSKISCRTVVFLRNDVYELLVESMPDRGKIAKITIDWTDPARLKELLRLRFVSNAENKHVDFDTLWRSIAESHIEGQETSSYIVERSLMRPRALIDLVQLCKESAVGSNHKKILKHDFEVGLKAYSTSLINQINLEIRDVEPDVYPQAKHLLFAFLEAPALLEEHALLDIISRLGFETEKHERIIELLLWYGFLGIQRKDGTATYIYNVNYEMVKLMAVRDKRPVADRVYCINPAFWVGLDISVSRP